MKMPTFAKLWRAVWAALLIFAASVFLLEVLVRIFMPQESPSLWLRPDEKYGHLMKPNYHQMFSFSGTDFVMDVQTNSLGFRDAEPPPPKPGVLNVVYAGDSFTFGHGVSVEQRFDSLVKESLKANGQSIRSVNVGVNAWGTLQATRYVQANLGQLHPDVVVLTFCENDPHDDTYFLEHGISFDRIRFPGKDFLRAHSHLFRLAQHLYLTYRKRAAMAWASKAAPAMENNELSQKSEAQDERAKAEGVPVMAFAPPISEWQWQRTEAFLFEFMQGFRAHNPNGRLFLQATDPLNEDISRHLAALCARIPGATYVDLAPMASRLTLAERRLPFDGHWSPAMHAASAEALARLLQN